MSCFDDDGNMDESCIWHIVGAYFHRFGVVRHQIESFDNFMTNSLPHIIQESSDVIVRVSTSFMASKAL